jgi:hypothetical protein
MVLIGARLGRVLKEAAQRGWNMVLAVLSYTELDERGAFASSLLDMEVDVEGGAKRSQASYT